MALIKCCACGRRMLESQGLRFCTNCGAPLQPEAPVRQQERMPALFVPETEALPEPAPPPEASRALTPRASRSVVRASGASDYSSIEPYGKRQAMEIEPYSAPRMPQYYAEPPGWPGWDGGDRQYSDQYTTIVTEVPGAPETGQYTRDGLPWWFPRRPPDIAGKLIYVQEHRQYHRHGDIGDGFARMAGDAVWGVIGGGGAGAGGQQHPWGGHGESVVTMLRVRTDDGTQRDARVRGHLTGANLTLGDRVELWGWKWRGVLRVRRGYNRTSRSVVSSTAIRSPLPLLLLLLVLGVAFFLWLHWSHIPLWPGW